jgi:ESS family glutamate:Na+ symporter
MMCVALGIGQAVFLILKKFDLTLPIHVCTMLGGILIRLYLDWRNTDEAQYEAIDIVGDFSLALFVSMSIVSMRLWQLEGLGLALIILLVAQVVLMLLFAYFITFNLCGRNYDASIISVGHTGFGLGAVPVSMTTMQAVCKKYRYSKLAFFVVPVIGGFISNITNAFVITKFINHATNLLKG